MDPSDGNLVSIFKTGDPGVLPLATMALEAEGIEYAIRSAGKADTLQWTMSQLPTNRPRVMEIVVAADVAARARDLVIDLEAPIGDPAPLDPAASAAALNPPTITIEDAVTGIAVGVMTENQLQELSSHLEEEAPRQYFVDASTIARLRSAHVEAELVSMLEQAVGGGPGLAIRWVVR